MKITSAHVDLSSARMQSTTRSQSTRVRAWTEPQNAADPISAPSSAARLDLRGTSGPAVTGSLPEPTRLQLPAAPPPPPAKTRCDTTDGSSKADKATVKAVSEFLNSKEGIHLMLLKAILEQTTGRKFVLAAGPDYTLCQEDQARIDEISSAAAANVSGASTTNAAQAPTRVGWGLEIQSEQRVEQHERTSVDASGTLLTSDGRQIQFDANFSYARDEVSVSKFELRAGDAKLKDPLVLVFDGTTPQLGRSLSFDLDADGKTERVALPTGNNAATLVYDRNGNGHVDDGSELFGASSGNGFNELSALDDDGNGFIDEGDSAFQHLYTWQSRDGDRDTLASLSQRGVGALFTGSIASHFELKSADGALQGRIRETSVFITEKGEVRALQQIDLRVDPEPAAT